MSVVRTGRKPVKPLITAAWLKVSPPLGAGILRCSLFSWQTDQYTLFSFTTPVSVIESLAQISDGGIANLP